MFLCHFIECLGCRYSSFSQLSNMLFCQQVFWSFSLWDDQDEDLVNMCSVSLVWFFIVWTCLGVTRGSCLINSWLGASLVVELAKLLCTSVARGISLLYSLLFAITKCRYCSIYWFLCSVSPSVWGWKVVDIFHVMPSSLARAHPKWLVKWGSLSDITFAGSPNQGYTCS